MESATSAYFSQFLTVAKTKVPALLQALTMATKQEMIIVHRQHKYDPQILSMHGCSYDDIDIAVKPSNYRIDYDQITDVHFHHALQKLQSIGLNQQTEDANHTPIALNDAHSNHAHKSDNNSNDSDNACIDSEMNECIYSKETQRFREQFPSRINQSNSNTNNHNYNTFEFGVCLKNLEISDDKFAL